ncbi:angiotensin-converting enzyme-like isoform X1 [Polistes fuscatus]|uniref:angiotensin-converting enzyme-like isoform X1 n=1 Tax=Polistes fuscatus TaxID=30207 RepID=UPI001CA9746E|nr:angiotensin-converting enzyme-like isoform X1 [Polistes fuscatus]XP_043492224.1 angiotensin-converting enzyme-like isoform X1 [Polistes fuscatus]XP_043492225.1 angiotensin-converting enzyme-like isoform X1 [Polistes fuscatus]
MLPKWTWIVVNLFIYTIATSYGDHAKPTIELTELGYEDTCNDTATAEWSFINSFTNQTIYTIWEEKQIQYGNYKKSQKEEIASISEIISENPLLAYKYNVIEKPGDALLDEQDFKELVHFSSSAEVLRSSVKYVGKTKNYTREDVDRLLSHKGRHEDKYDAWKSWHEELKPLVGNFSKILRLVDKAAKANGINSAVEYWEMLSGYPDGYEQIKSQWNGILNLHKTILEFSRNHLSQKYGINLTETIPAHLLGSLQGYDWSTFSIDISPYSEITFDIRKNLWKKKLLGKSLYKAASNMGSILLGQVPQSDFWKRSQFHQHCPPKLVNFCKYGIIQISTCFEPTIANYILTHKNIGKVLFQQMSVERTPILNTANRYSALEEALSELFGILSASPVWLQRNHLIYNVSDSDQKIVSLMITALDVLPRLAYYISADLWRINAIENNITDSAELIKSWWEYRSEYEGISKPESIDVPTFLNDEYITSNKPYLSKFVGIILGFQIYEDIMKSTEVRYDISIKKGYSNLIKLIHQGSAESWMDALDKVLEMDDISKYSLTSFFSPLESFIEEMNEEENDHNFQSNDDAELEEVERMIIKEINAPTTTPSTTTTTKIHTTTFSIKKKYASEKLNDLSKSKKPLDSDLSSNIQADKPKSDTDSVTVNPFEKSFDFSDLEKEDEQKPKTHTSTAVWIVAAVLIATVIICIIAIFGRQKFRKTSKNRRYV